MIPAKTHRATPGQTVGPFFAYGLEFPKQHEVVFPHSPGAIVLSARCTTGRERRSPTPSWRIFGADADGSVPAPRGAFRRDDHTFTGFGRAFTDDEGRYSFWTREPGGIRGGAEFFAAIVFARGLPDKLHTRIYSPADDDALAADPLLSALTSQERASLVATRTHDGYLSHDIRLQGENETVFLAF